MRILRVIASMDPSSGGPCQGIRNSIPELKKLGIENEVVCLDHPSAAFLGKDPFPTYPLGPSKSPWCYTPKLSSWLIDNLHHYNYVIIHGLWLYHGYAVKDAIIKLRKEFAISKVQSKIPQVFVMPHGMLDPYFQKTNGRFIKSARNWIYWKLIESKIVNQADGVLFTCQEELELARIPFRPYYPKRELNVGYGIAQPPAYKEDFLSSFLEKCPEVANSNYYLFLSRIHEKKGVDILIKAYESVISKLDDSLRKDFPKLVIAGPGLNTPYGEKMLQVVSNSTLLAQSVFFPGMLSGAAKWGAFYGSEAFILPSHQENFGIAVVEALACSKPVLISNRVNIWKEIQSDNAGFISYDTLEGTKQLFEKWYTLNDKQKEQMKENAKLCFAKKFSIVNTAKQLMQVIKTI